MIDSVDIIRTLRTLLKSNFNNKKIMQKDIKTPETACFYIRYVTGKDNQSATEYFTDKSSYEIVYFAEDENDTELNTIKDKLKRILRKPLKVFLYDEENKEITNEFQLVNINNLSININENDYFLTCLLDIELTEQDLNNDSSALDDDFTNNEIMEDLIINKGD